MVLGTFCFEDQPYIYLNFKKIASSITSYTLCQVMFKGRYTVFSELCFSKILISNKLFVLLKFSNLQAMPRAFSRPRC